MNEKPRLCCKAKVTWLWDGLKWSFGYVGVTQRRNSVSVFLYKVASGTMTPGSNGHKEVAWRIV
ncbi:MAG: hypothetical protein FD130_605 [Halothiobacillaceae bacterium]|nr:MAG: hypothetical protein FD130_605 [Halothiobacillaceae bacterium]